MTRTRVLLISAAIASLSAGSALADCASEIAAMRQADMSSTASTTPSEGKTTNFETGENVPKGGKVAEDGSMAPLEAAPADQAGAKPGSSVGSTKASPAGTTADAGGTTTTPGQTATGGSVSKDGGTMPLASAQGGEDTNVAMSGQDAQSQQSGQATAAMSAEMTASLAKAEAAAKGGDEAACMKALQEAQPSKG